MGLPRPNDAADRHVATPPKVSAFQRALLRWYKRHQRPLPWRETRDPYKILVSEVMLQQTQVDRVMPKYRQFLERYPNFHALAKAKLPELKKVWYPLGYNVRPIRLRKIAQTVIKEHGGQLPSSYDGLVALEGIGRYTAGAVLSFAFGQDAPILDTNVARLLQRYFGRASSPFSRRQLWELAERVIPKGTAPARSSLARKSRGGEAPQGNAYDINQAMMDLGATVCTARKPKCPSCALRRSCSGYPYEQIHVAAADPSGDRRD